MSGRRTGEEKAGEAIREKGGRRKESEGNLKQKAEEGEILYGNGIGRNDSIYKNMCLFVSFSK